MSLTNVRNPRWDMRSPPVQHRQQFLDWFVTGPCTPKHHGIHGLDACGWVRTSVLIRLGRIFPVRL